MRRLYRVLSLLLTLVLLSAGCAMQNTAGNHAEGEASGKLSPELMADGLNKYIIDIAYDPDERTAAGHERLFFTNNQSEALRDIVLHLYPNAYKARETVPAIGSLEDSFPEGFNPGGITVSNVRVENKKADFSIDNMVMRISLHKPLEKGRSLVLDMDFRLLLPQCRARYGTYGGISQFVYWYPILAVYDGGWQTRSYYPIGESNYSEIADYEVSVNVPAGEIVAATGAIAGENSSKPAGDSRKTIHIKAQGVRDFVWTCSRDYLVKETEAEGIRIKSYYTPQNSALGSKANEMAAQILKYYNESFGKYPYRDFTMAETWLEGGAMEYPQLIALGQRHYTGASLLEHAIAHEGAHQWWYVTVGNDEYTYPWLDESFAVYSTEMYMAHSSGDAGQLAAQMERMRAAAYSTVPISSPVSSFSTWPDYMAAAYKAGAVVLYDLSGLAGNDEFVAIMRKYYSRYKFKNATTGDFIQVVRDIAGEKASEWLEKRLTEPAG